MATPTLVFPRSVAQKVPMFLSAGSVHDDPLWLMKVRRTLPDIPIVQIPEALAEVYATQGSVSRPGVDRSSAYIHLGVRELADQSGRVRGDYLLTSPVSSALEVGSFAGVYRSMAAGVRFGRPGPWAWAYAMAAVLRIAWRRARNRLAKVARRH